MQDLKFGVSFGLIAAFVNYFLLLPVYGQLYFHFGQAVVLLCLIFCQFRSGFIALLFSLLSLSLISGHNLFAPILIFEFLTIYALRRHGFNLLTSSFIYWVVLGMPMVYVLLQHNTSFSEEYLGLASVKHFVNSMIYMLVLSVLLLLLPTKLTFKARGKSIPKLSTYIYFMLNISIILPTILVALVLTTRNVEQQESQIQENIKSASKQFSFVVNTYLNNHFNIVESISSSIDERSDQQTILNSTQKYFPGFISMIVTDEFGTVVGGAPENFYNKLKSLPKEKLSVKDRDYFRIPRMSGENYISDAFVGRGFGSDTIVAISSPIFHSGEFKGIVEGSLNLPKFGELEADIFTGSNATFFIVTDASDKIVFSSSQLALSTLEKFTPNSIENFYSQESKMLKLNDSEYLFDYAQNEFAWKVYVLSTTDEVINIFTRNVTILMSTILIICGVFLFITKRFANQLTQPLILLIKNFESGEKTDDVVYTTMEIKNLAERLSDAKNVMDSFNKQLEKQVNLKTTELSHLNKELLKLSNEDTLTGLFNRRSFDQQAERVVQVNSRNKQPMGIAVIDIDNFKQINDKYGHDIGDLCLIKTAELMREHFNRKSDVCARYGGDELVLLLSSGTHDTQLKQLNAFLAAINTQSISINSEMVTFTVSVGVAFVEDNFETNFVKLLKYADQKLYESKEQGRNRISEIVL